MIDSWLLILCDDSFEWLNSSRRYQQQLKVESWGFVISQIIFTLVVGLIGGGIARRLKLPAAFMTGSMLAVAMVSIATEQMLMPSTLKTFAQIISGAYIGQQISKRDIKNLPQIAGAICLLMALFTANTFLMGVVFSTYFGFDYITALLSCLPGGIMDVSLISIDMGAQAEIVATMQLARLVGMLIILPYWTTFILNRLAPVTKEPVTTHRKKMDKQLPIGMQGIVSNNVLILVVAGIGGLVGVYLHIPVGALIFSLIFSASLKILKNTAPLSNSIRYIAQAFAGSIIGCTFTRGSLSQLGQLILPVVLLLTSYLVINVIFAFIISKRGILDLKSALFASSPAGATDISLIAGELGGDMPKIAGIQISRTLYTIIVLPNLIQWFLH